MADREPDELTDFVGNLLELARGATCEEDVETGSGELESKVAADTGSRTRHNCMSKRRQFRVASGKQSQTSRTSPSALLCAEARQLIFRAGQSTINEEKRIQNNWTDRDPWTGEVHQHAREAEDVATEPSCADERERERRQRAVGGCELTDGESASRRAEQRRTESRAPHSRT